MASASIARFARCANFTRNSAFLGQVSVRTGVNYIKNFVDKKEYYDADRLPDSTFAKASFDALSARGFCRPRKAYDPPDDIEQRLRAVVGRVLPSALEGIWKEIPISGKEKARFIAECTREFSHSVPSVELTELRSVGDVADFFRTRVEGMNPYDRLVHAHPNDLPDNLYAIPDGIRFKPGGVGPESLGPGGLFKGITAYPGSGTIVTGLRARKKYGPGFRMDREWPYELTLEKI